MHRVFNNRTKDLHRHHRNETVESALRLAWSYTADHPAAASAPWSELAKPDKYCPEYKSCHSRSPAEIIGPQKSESEMMKSEEFVPGKLL